MLLELFESRSSARGALPIERVVRARTQRGRQKGSACSSRSCRLSRRHHARRLPTRLHDDQVIILDESRPAPVHRDPLTSFFLPSSPNTERTTRRHRRAAALPPRLGHSRGSGGTATASCSPPGPAGPATTLSSSTTSTRSGRDLQPILLQEVISIHQLAGAAGARHLNVRGPSRSSSLILPF